MLSVGDRRCGRRAFLRVGGLSLGGLGLPGLLEARAALSQAGRPVRDKSVVFLFMHGGPPQAETFDPKMTAPEGSRSVTGEVKTTLPGVTYGATLQRLAKLAHRTAVVRSFVTGDGNHDIKPVVGRASAGANLGSLYARVAGTTHPLTGIPSNVALFPRAVAPEAQAANLNFGDFKSSGPLARSFSPFDAGGACDLRDDMVLRIEQGRLEDRRALLGGLDKIRRGLDGGGALAGVDRFRQQAFDVVLGGAADAFDLSKEDPRTIERYDTSRLVPPATISKKWNNHKNYADHGQTLGKLMLMARRLCEAGCGFVTVTTNFVWDMHADKNNATVEEGMRYCGLPFDHAVSAFLEDVEARGLSEQILLVCCGEMGRTPTLNKRGGRDHWGGLAPLLLAGGGLRMGQVVGASDERAGAPATDPVTIPDLNATILHTLLDIGQVRTMGGIPAEVMRALTGGRPVPALV